MRFTEAEWMAYQESGDDEIEAILDWDYPRDVDYLRDVENKK